MPFGIKLPFGGGGDQQQQQDASQQPGAAAASDSEGEGREKSLVDKAKEKGREALDAGKEKGQALVKEGVEKLEVKGAALLQEGKALGAEVASMAKEKVKAELPKVVAEIERLSDKLKKEADAWAEERKAQMQPWLDKQREKAHMWMVEKLEGLLDNGLDRLKPVAKKNIKDPYMPRLLQRMIDHIVDSLWPGLKEETIELVLGDLRPKPVIEDGELIRWGCCCGGCVAALRYHIYPFDKSFWKSMRDPMWVVWQLLLKVPVVGVLPALYAFLLLIIDREDEYQLIQYIVGFKGSQFITLGVIKTLMGSVLLYMCATDEDQDCKSVWEWNGLLETISVLFFISQVLMTWAAFLCLPGSKKKGSFLVLLKEEHQRKGIELSDEYYETSTKEVRESRYVTDEKDVPKLGHHLMKWLVYDLIVFTVCIILTALAMFLHVQEASRVVGGQREGGVSSNWRFTMTLFWIQVFYGLMSFPFLIFLIPFADTWFTHARPTAYTSAGNCVPYMGLSKEERNRVFEEQRAAAAARDAALRVDEEDDLQQGPGSSSDRKPADAAGAAAAAN